MSPIGFSTGGALGMRGSEGAPIIVAFGVRAVASCAGVGAVTPALSGIVVDGTFQPPDPGPTAAMSCSVGAPSGI